VYKPISHLFLVGFFVGVRNGSNSTGAMIFKYYFAFEMGVSFFICT